MQALCKRKYKTLTLLAVVAGLFYMLQCLSVFRLGELSDARARAWGQSNHKASSYLHDDDDEKILLKGRNRIVDGESRMYNGIDDEDWIITRRKGDSSSDLKFADQLNPSKLKETKLGNNEDIMVVDMKVVNAVKEEQAKGIYGKHGYKTPKKDTSGQTTIEIRGVHSKDKHLYLVGEDGLFSCLSDKKTKIPLEQVNDDFCDCADGSDEPGTPACPRASFYCKLQVPGLPPQSITSSKVNDGICDCCDGSDEWAGVLLPDSIRIKDGEKLGAVFHAPCSDKCKSIMDVQRKEQLTRERGQKLQREYIKQAVHDVPQPEQRKKYGPNGVFYKLSKQCFNLRDKEYTYQVCPFSRVEQKTHNVNPTNLGRRADSIVIDKGQHLLMMTDGDTKLCPFGRARRSKIYLLCDVEEILLKVTESELCEYTFTLTTPAAC